MFIEARAWYNSVGQERPTIITPKEYYRPDDLGSVVIFCDPDMDSRRYLFSWDGNIPSIVDDPNFPAVKLAEDKDKIWEAIKGERERRLVTSGFKVEVSAGVFKWFHSDIFSRTQQIGLTILGASVPAIQWKTMDGSFVQLSPEIVQKLFAAGLSFDAAMFTAAEQQKVIAWSLPDPMSYYDYALDSSWPERFSG